MKAWPSRILQTVSSATMLAGTVAFCGTAALALSVYPANTAHTNPSTVARVQGTLLASGPATVPAGSFCIGIVDAIQQPGASVSHAHAAGFVYVLRGANSLRVLEAPDSTITVGQAVFVGDSIAHTHANPSADAASSWIFVGVRPAGTCQSITPVPGTVHVYASPDLPPLPHVQYRETLSELHLANGESVTLRPAPAQAVLILDGSLTVTTDGRTAPLITGQAFNVADGATARVQSGSATRLLIFVLR